MESVRFRVRIRVRIRVSVTVRVTCVSVLKCTVFKICYSSPQREQSEI